MKQQSEICTIFNEWLNSIHRHSRASISNQNVEVTPRPNAILKELEKVADDNMLIIIRKFALILMILKRKLSFWNSTVVCYVVGANPPIHVMKGFIHRILKNFKVN